MPTPQPKLSLSQMLKQVEPEPQKEAGAEKMNEGINRRMIPWMQSYCATLGWTVSLSSWNLQNQVKCSLDSKTQQQAHTWTITLNQLTLRKIVYRAITQLNSFITAGYCKWAGPHGSSQGSGSRYFPHILCFSSSLKYLDNSIWGTFPELFYRCETPPHQVEDVNYLMAMST